MRERLAKIFERATSRLDTAGYIWTGFTLVSTFVTAHFASANNWIASFGAIGYWSAGLLGGLVVALIGLVIARIRLWWLTGGAIDKWKKDVSSVNPLDDQFTKLRLRLSDLAHPITKKISNKTLVNCELMGPANVIVTGNGGFNSAAFMNCDIVVLRPPPPEIPVHNCIVLDNVHVIGGSIWNVTLLIPREMVHTFENMGAKILTAIPNESPAPQLPLGTATGTPL
jgi:hypothetical protein